MQGTFAIEGLPMPIAAIVLRRPARPLFLNSDSSNFNGLHLISFCLAHARGE